MSHFEAHLNRPVSELIVQMQQRIMQATHYQGIQTLKNPLDFWIYQEILFECQIDVIIEIGNYCGGSTLALAHSCDNLGRGRVLAVDRDQQPIPERVRQHPRIQCFEGEACALFAQVQDHIQAHDRVMIIEDSAHSFDNTHNVLLTYAQLVSPGSYFIVEDSILQHGLPYGPHPGPYEAIQVFLAAHSDFEVDRSREAFGLTWNPSGFLRRLRK